MFYSEESLAFWQCPTADKKRDTSALEEKRSLSLRTRGRMEIRSAAYLFPQFDLHAISPPE